MLELLAPAGSMEALRAAVENGADAVYLGCGSFNARQSAKNFTVQTLAEAVKYCHIRGVAVHLTLNTLVSDRECKGVAQLIAQAEYLILNELEGGALSEQSQPLPCLRALLARCPHSKIVLTLGEAGAFYADEGRVLHQRAMAAEAVDTSAAGDTFTGFFLGGLFSGQPVEAALRIAAQAAAIAVSRPGAAESIPLLGEVSAFF